MTYKTVNSKINRRYSKKILHLDIKFIAYTLPYLYLSNKKYLNLPLKIAVNLSFQPTQLRPLLPFQIFDMLLILVNKNTDIMRVFGNGERVGEVKLWLSKEQVELEEQPMDIVIDYIPLHYTQILWKNIPCRKYVNCLWNQFFCN